MTDQARQHVLQWERSTRPIAIRPELVRITGSVDGAYLLSQILYWFGEDEAGQTRARVEHDGEIWIAKTPEDWAIELGYVTESGEPRPKIIRRVIHNLKAAGLVETDVFRFDGLTTTHVRPSWDALEAALPALPVWAKRNTPNGQSGIPRAGQSALPAVGKPSKETETTTKTTGLNQAGGGSGSERGVVPASAGTAAAPSASGVVEAARAKRATGLPREKPARTPTEQQQFFEAVAGACGMDPAFMAEADRTNVGRLASRLRADPEIDLAFVADCAAAWGSQFPGRATAEIRPPSVGQFTTWIGRRKAARLPQARPSAEF